MKSIYVLNEECKKAGVHFEYNTFNGDDKEFCCLIHICKLTPADHMYLQKKEPLTTNLIFI